MISQTEVLAELVVDGFWKGDDYKKVVRRVEDGFQFCSDLSRMVQERAELEGKHAHKLQQWSSKWSEFIEKGSEYGTCKDVLLTSLKEATTLAQVHTGMVARLGDLQTEMKKWRAECFRKTVMGACKEARSLEEEFKKAQKPWLHYWAKLQRYQKEKEVLEKNIKVLEMTIAGVGEQDKKMQEKLEKQRREVEQLEDKVAKVLKDIRIQRPVYLGEMEDLFEKSQVLEGRRLEFVKDTLSGLHASVDLSLIDSIPMVYMQWRRRLLDLEPSKDLRHWAHLNGLSSSPPPESQALPFIEKSAKKGKAPSVEASLPTKPVRTDHQQHLVTATIKKTNDYNEELNPFGDDDASSIEETPSVEEPQPAKRPSQLPPDPPRSIPEHPRSTLNLPRSTPDLNKPTTGSSRPTHQEAPSLPPNDTSSLKTGASNSSLSSLNSTTAPPPLPPIEPLATTSPPDSDALSHSSTDSKVAIDERKYVIGHNYKPELNPFGDSTP